jgi:hypothetical protein
MGIIRVGTDKSKCQPRLERAADTNQPGPVFIEVAFSAGALRGTARHCAKPVSL